MSQQPGGPQMPQQPHVPSYSTGSEYPAAPGNRVGNGQPPFGGQPVGQGFGQPPYGEQPGPGGQSGPPNKRNWFARHKFLTVLAAIVVLIIVIAAASAAGSSSDDATDAQPAATQQNDATTSAQDDQASQEAANKKPAKEKAAEEKPAKNNSSQDDEEAAGDESSEDADEVANNAQQTRDNSSAKATTLGAGTFTVGKDVAPGRYVITPKGGQSGNLNTTEPDGMLGINEILGDAMGMGVPSVTSTLEKGTKIEVSGLSSVKFTPAKTKLRTTLTAGDWVVGQDIKAGDYVAKPAGDQSGNFVIYGSFGLPKTNEILGDAMGMGVPDVTVSLEDGDEIAISGLSKVKFTAK